ncbi:RBPJ-interacting and tubulin-associated protein 1 [Perognathus longimembris pacificus]|uniref:RBPJ-interacting and tubulin-associated protein 1 n=1 Tax=Perognathus longimembris pacificus TaxID=214514 RepID=UPI002018F8BE|nr:RBPJ-interacting and tubulin-associated protein 1 [Perognathus longimembris pacificus]XP_048198865.1 RBPJ-interacting and tubulin-associated protein 1 [Perognathus longimembris pacificus]XP_048198866.1 RBPJ-interacting and tubulin-associated protein 1 [Perognathus longimembris pacificus]
MQTLHLQQRSPGYRVKARESYVDETLFGSPAGTRPALPDFDPPWVQKTNKTRGSATGASQAFTEPGSSEVTSSRGSTPTLTPRKKNKYRLLRHTPTFCDESLFGPRPGGVRQEASGMAKGDPTKLHALFWTPPATPRTGHSPRPRDTPLRAIHPACSSKTEPGVTADSRNLSLHRAGAPRPLGQGRSRSVTQLNGPSSLQTNGPQDPRPSTAGVTFRRPPLTPRARSASISVPAASGPQAAPRKSKPPWR